MCETETGINPPMIELQESYAAQRFGCSERQDHITDFLWNQSSREVFPAWLLNNQDARFSSPDGNAMLVQVDRPY